MRTSFVPRVLAVVVIATLTNLVGGAAALAAPGDLDPTFDSDGKVTTDFGDTNEGATAVAVQPDGKIIAVGSGFAVLRYDSDGSLDATFDGDGIAFTDFGGVGDQAWAVGLQPDGKIVAAGWSWVSMFDS
jgi:uncharacterized delta-60 repeat protein